MPLVFVHGVANRASPEWNLETVQRDALFRQIAFANDAMTIKNPYWGGGGAGWSAGLPWLPDPKKIQAFGGNNPIAGDVGLGAIAKIDGMQAVDLIVMAALEASIDEARKRNADAPSAEAVALARDAAIYLEKNGLDSALAPPKGSNELAAESDKAFARALDAMLALQKQEDEQAYGIGSLLSAAVDDLSGRIGNTLSDAALRLKRRSLSEGVSLFLGDIFVYLRDRDMPGAQGTAARIFEPILTDLAAAAKAPRRDKEPFVAVGHSLGGVILYDILTDQVCLKRLNDEVPGFKIDCWLTVGSQPGFFADLGLYPNKPRGATNLLLKPACVETWLNVYDYTDVFSFLCKPFFEEVQDFGYDTVVDVLQAHTAYFKRPSFYKRLNLRLRELGMP